jgi:hypothetical protein
MFVGTNVMQWDKGRAEDVLSIVSDSCPVTAPTVPTVHLASPVPLVQGIGAGCIFVGFMDMLFGFKCNEKDTANESGMGNANDGGANINVSTGGGPTLTVNVTPAQAAQAASVAAKAAASNSDNPFFGNRHIANQQ